MTMTYATRNGETTCKIDGGPWALVGVGDGRKAAAADLLAKAVRAYDATSHRYLFCGDGTMLVVRWFGESWGYDILHADTDRESVASCLTNREFVADVVADAVRHAEQSYGGVVRQLRG